MEVPATEAGVLSEIRVQEGETAPVGAIVGVIGGAAAGLRIQMQPARPASEAPRARHPARARACGPPERPTAHAGAAPQPIKLDPFFEVRTPERITARRGSPGGVAVTPLARRLAAEAGIDLSRARLRPARPHRRARHRKRAALPGCGRAAAPAGPSAEQVKALYDAGQLRGGAARRHAPHHRGAAASQAKQTIPHFYMTADIEIDRLKALREEVNAAAPKDRDGAPAFKLSLNDFIIRALALALQRVPAANAVWAGDRILRFKHSDIGVAVALEGGLITPVDPQRRNQVGERDLGRDEGACGARARQEAQTCRNIRAARAAISNLGMYGVREFSAIINPPHATILAVGAARRQAVEKHDGGVGFASMLTVTLSCDHRVVDGALGRRACWRRSRAMSSSR